MADLQSLKIDRSASAPAPRRARRRWWLLALAIALVLLFVWSRRNPAPDVQAVSVVNVWPSQALTVLNATGYVAAQRKAAVASKATGRLEWLGVREGSKVKAGEVIARLESSDLQAQVEQAEANVAVARAQLREAEAELHNAALNFRRAADLQAKKLLSVSDFDQSEALHKRAQAAVGARQAALAAAEANVRVVRVAFDNTLVRAPFDGIILNKNANVGDVLSPFNTGLSSKGAVVDIADMNTLEVEADVSESSLAKVSIGQACEIQLDALPDVRLLGEVASMVPAVDRSKATVMFKIRFLENDARVLPDMAAKVAFLSRPLNADERQPRTGVSAEALRTAGSGNAGQEAFVIEQGKLRRVAVQSGETLGDFVVVQSGLNVGDRVVRQPGADLQDGVAVTLVESGK